MVPFTSLHLDARRSAPLHRQLYAEIRGAVLSGRLAAGARLPSTRSLAADLGVSRNTVAAAFDQLMAEGYLEGKVGSGTFVTDLGREEPPGGAAPHAGRRDAALLSARGRMLAQARAARLRRWQRRGHSGRVYRRWTRSRANCGPGCRRAWPGGRAPKC